MNKKGIVIGIIVLIMIILIVTIAMSSGTPAPSEFDPPAANTTPAAGTDQAVKNVTPPEWIKKVSVEKAVIAADMKTGDGSLNLAEIMVFDGNNKNIALGRNVTSSSTYDAARFPQTSINDGDLDTIIHTKATYDPLAKTPFIEFISFSLPDPVTAADAATRIEVYNRTQFPGRIKGAKLIITKNTGQKVTYEFDGILDKYTFNVK